MTPLTELAHTLVRAVLQPGDIAIDATAGNGHDTLFLAECVGPTGTVYSFDIQLAALAVTSMRLAAANLSNVILLQRSHAQMRSALPNVRPGKVAAVMLNLGYLPGGDKRLTTQTASTITAIRDGLTLIAPGGIMTIVVYPGHRGGANEATAVERLLNELPPASFEVHEPSPTTDHNAAPRLFVVRKQATHPARPSTNDAAGVDGRPAST